MSYQGSKVKKTLGSTWDSMYEKWDRAPGKEFREDWIESNSKKLVNMCRVSATGLTPNESKRAQWVKDMFFENESEEEEVPEPLGNPVALSQLSVAWNVVLCSQR